MARVLTVTSDNQRLPMILGVICLLMWSMAAVYNSFLIKLPTFQILSVILAVTFFFTALVLTLRRQWYKIKQPPILWVVGFLGIFGSDAFFIEAFKHAPAAEVDVINYLWPLMVVLFAGCLPKEKLTFIHIIAGFVAFIGTFLLISHGHGFSGFHREYSLGYCLAFLDGAVWALYVLVARHYKNTPVEMIGMYCGTGMLASLFLHFRFETYVTPSNLQWMIMLLAGLTNQGVAFFLWDFAVKRGDFKLLSIVSYASPVLAIVWLTLLGIISPAFYLLIAASLVACGGLIAGINWQKLLSSRESYH